MNNVAAQDVESMPRNFVTADDEDDEDSVMVTLLERQMMEMEIEVLWQG